MPSTTSRILVPAERIEHAIHVLRGQKVMLDAELAAMYGVDTRELVQAVKRNIGRFPGDFMFQLTADEFELLRSQSVISKPAGSGGRRIAPYAFTEQGIAMLSSVLRSARAVRVNIEIMRAFVRLRQMLQENAELARKLAVLERKYDGQIRVILNRIPTQNFRLWRCCQPHPALDPNPRGHQGSHGAIILRPLALVGDPVDGRDCGQQGRQRVVALAKATKCRWKAR